jgi:hypothetical protein
MPQTSEELRAKWGGECGVGEDKAVTFLDRHGFRITSRYDWVRATPPTPEEAEAMQFLMEEWDWGGYVRPIDWQPNK